MHPHATESIIAMKKAAMILGIILLAGVILTAVDVFTGFTTAEGVSSFARMAHNASWTIWGIIIGRIFVHPSPSRR